MAYDAVDHQGRWVQVEDDVARVVKEIERLYPELSVKYCENPGIGDAPYMVVEKTADGQEFAVLTAWQLDDRLLDLLHAADTTRHDVQAMLDKTNAKVLKDRADQIAGWKEYCRDVLVSASRHIGSSFTFSDPREGHEGEIIKVEDDPSRRTKVN